MASKFSTIELDTQLFIYVEASETGDLPTSSSWLAGIVGFYHYAQFISSLNIAHYVGAGHQL